MWIFARTTLADYDVVLRFRLVAERVRFRGSLAGRRSVGPAGFIAAAILARMQRPLCIYLNYEFVLKWSFLALFPCSCCVHSPQQLTLIHISRYTSVWLPSSPFSASATALHTAIPELLTHTSSQESQPEQQPRSLLMNLK